MGLECFLGMSFFYLLGALVSKWESKYRREQIGGDGANVGYIDAAMFQDMQ